MLFTQIEFYFFFAVVFAVLLVARSFAIQKLVLLVASYYFYAYWDWRFAGLLLACTAVNYWLAGRMERSDNPGFRKLLVALSLVYSLGVLAYFKYFNFFVDTFKALIGEDPERFGALNIILPIGISFFTFQTLSYTIDVYRRDLKHCRRFTDFALYVAFFPQLVAGPIVRAAEFLPQLETRRVITWERGYDGFRQFVFGLFKKVFIADSLAQFVDPAFDSAGVLSGVTLWIAALAYAIQIYADFSGYSDMAIGLARAMGFDLSRNFDHPYLSRSVQEFWRRWHISLSSWLRDYLYIPLGGNRLGKVRNYVNLMLTMLLGGLWHGASWTFVFWGGWHGLALCAGRWWSQRRKGRKPREEGSHLLSSLIGWGITMLVVIVGWVFFRSPSFEVALTILGKMFTLAEGVSWYQPFTIGVIVAVSSYHLLLALGYRKWFELRANTVWAPAVLFTMIWLVIAFYPHDFQPFIYFQF